MTKLLKVFCASFLIAILFYNMSIAATDVRESMVKIYCVKNTPDYDNPWNMSGPGSSSGSGCVIKGNLILTNAHVVSDQTFLQVRLYGQSKKHTAKVVSVSHEADLALITVDNPAFFKGIKPIQFGKLPEVQDEVIVYGFPEGGDSLSTTIGVISRIEHQRYAHSLIKLLAAQLDAAINSGNSGGPVIIGDRIVGVVMQSLEDSENIGYMVPVPVIDHFLVDVEDGHYDGFPQLGVGLQNLENETLKNIFNVKNNISGVLVTFIIPGTPAAGKIFSGDVIISIAGHDIADDGTVEFRPKERTNLNYYIQQHQIGENLKLTLLRNGKKHKINLSLDTAWGNNYLVSRFRYDVRPTYFIYGGLVFCPLSMDYLMTWEEEWTTEAPSNLLNFAINEEPTVKGEKVIIISKVLQSELNNGYQDYTDERIVEVNDKKIKNLTELVNIIENNKDQRYVIFKTESRKLIGFDREKVKAEQPQILKTYQIPNDRSEDLL